MRKDYDLTARIVELAAVAPAQAGWGDVQEGMSQDDDTGKLAQWTPPRHTKQAFAIGCSRWCCR